MGGAIGADPVTMTFTLPPSIACILRNTNLSQSVALVTIPLQVMNRIYQMLLESVGISIN